MHIVGKLNLHIVTAVVARRQAIPAGVGIYGLTNSLVSVRELQRQAGADGKREVYATLLVVSHGGRRVEHREWDAPGPIAVPMFQ
jgi:hypothetical protein